jgi:uncharacterized GH25 family protein
VRPFATIRPLTAAGVLAAAVSVGAPARAHDFWLEPIPFRPAAGAPVSVSLWVGEHLTGDPVARDPARIERFVALAPGAASETSIAGEKGESPAGRLVASTPGTWVIGYRSTAAFVTLEPQKFESYLKQEGLDAVLKRRAELGESAAPGVERYSRCAKSLIRVGAGGASAHDRALGFTLEIVAETDPYSLKAGDALAVRLLFRGAPLEGALVTAIGSADPEKAVSSRSDASGRVAIRPSAPGMWLVKSVHMVQAPKDCGQEWESFWASLTFEIVDGPAARDGEK